MSEQTTDYPERLWQAISEDSAAGYERNSLGDWNLIGLVIYGPTTEKLRGTRLRGRQWIDGITQFLAPIRQQDPPTPQQVAESWRTLETWRVGRREHRERVEARRSTARLEAKGIAETCSPAQLARRDGEGPDEFYGRIAAAHRALSEVTPRPTQELARRAGVKSGTAAAWVSRARARGLLEKVGEEQ